MDHKAGEFVYDHPFLWGSKRTGPDLLRVGGYNDNWHFNLESTKYSAGSIMPGYKWLFDNKRIDISDIEGKMKVMQTLGVPYTDAEANAKMPLKNNLKD
jgi:cytochrome c oxidase cbb3-type subunit I/II